MKKILLALVLTLLTVTGCTDAEMASFGAYGDESDIKCWSGAAVIFEDTSTGKVAQLDGDGIVFKSKTTGKYVRAYADCIVTSK